jgi:hypothetical protein
MIIIGEDQFEVADQWIRPRFTQVGIETKIVDYKRPAGGGTYKTEPEVAREINALCSTAGEKTAFILDMSPVQSSNIEWGLRLIVQLANGLFAGGSDKENVLALLSNDNFVVIAHTKFELRQELIESVLQIKTDEMDFWSGINRSKWQHLNIPKIRSRPFFVYARKLQDDKQFVEKVAEWLKG